MTWHELLDQAITAFGDPPGRDLEQRLINAYAEHPSAVQVTLGKVTQSFKQGKIRTPWGVVATELDKQLTVRRNLPASSERAVHERNAEQWLRTCGLHYDRWAEVHDELFGDRGKLAPWIQDQVLEARLRKLWDEVRPTGEQLEREEIERADKWKNTRPARTKAAA